MASNIGIKIANGEFYPIVEENSSVKKRLVLTTVHDKQRSVQIDLYKSYTRTMADALYIGSLVVENIKPRPKGEPSIELVISSTQKGVITADAVDTDTTSKGEHQTLNVSLQSLEDDNRDYDIPDFELDRSESTPTGLFEKAAKVRKEGKQGFPWLLIICIALLLAAIGAAIWFFLLRDKGGTTAERPRPTVQASSPAQPSPPPVQQQPPTPAPQAPAAQQPPAPAAPAAQPAPTPAPASQTPPPVIQAPAAKAPASQSGTPARSQRRAPPVASYKVPSVIPAEGVPYTVRWGDTLWDIAEAFYRNPWLYPRIARFNNIRNPNLIISGTTIRVPPRN